MLRIVKWTQPKYRWFIWALVGAVLTLQAPGNAQESFSADGIPAVPLPDPPVEYDTAEGQRIRVSVVADGLTYPWGFAFLPDGRVLVTERLGTLRVIRDGVLDPTPLAGVPEVRTDQTLAGMMAVSYTHLTLPTKRIV